MNTVNARRPTRRRTLSAVVVALGFLVGACGSSSADPFAHHAGDIASDDATPYTNVDVAGGDNWYKPSTVEITVGTVVTWTNVGNVIHNIVPVSGNEFGVSQKVFVPGAKYRHRFDTPGSFSYYCQLHGTATAGMVSKVVVKAKG